MEQAVEHSYLLVERVPSVDEYLELRRAQGLPDISTKTAMTGLLNSLFSVCAFAGDAIVANARIIGDGGIYFYIQDFFVHPEHQGVGLEKLIMDSVMDYLREHASPDAFIGLMATEVNSGFCERFGFRKFIGSQFTLD